VSSPAAGAPRTLTIARRFCGPPDSGNGGYTCGLVANALPGVVAVTLRRPPPLDQELQLVRTPEGVALLDGDATVAEGRRAELALEPPPCPGLAVAAEAAARYHGLEQHAFPSCFVCGTGRDPGDGLRIFAGDAGVDGLVAAPWKPGGDLADADGRVRPEFVWAALDCPGAWAWLAELERPLVLGRLTASLDRPLRAGRLYIVGGWRLGRTGRKHESGTAVWSADGTVCARAQATWIEIDPERFLAG
jgi:hypothetical protein